MSGFENEAKPGYHDRNMRTSISLLVILASFLALIGLVYLGSGTGPSVNLDAFASCLREKGAVMYGTFWCPHCQDQKKEFGRSASAIPYVECSTPDGNGMLSVCEDKGIASVPVWKFADGSELLGTQSLRALSEKTSCVLPEGYVE